MECVDILQVVNLIILKVGEHNKGFCKLGLAKDL